MPAILQNLPFAIHSTEIELRGRRVKAKSDQIIVWIRIAEKGTERPHPRSMLLPAILDTGCNHNLVIRRDHLAEWAGGQPQRFQQLGRTRVHGQPAERVPANLWLQPNLPGRRDPIANSPPFLLEAPGGIVVTVATSPKDHPRLPLLGLRALRWAKLHVTIDGRRCRVTVRRSRRFGLFG